MNERIFELIQEQDGFRGLVWTEEDKKEFALLIVRECSGYVYNYPEKYLTRDQAREICLTMEEHFGVEE